MKKIYLAGSISCPDAKKWRNELISKLNQNKFVALDPLDRDEGMSFEDIFARDIWAIKNSDLLVAYSDKTIVTTGTAQELLYSKYFEIPVIFVAPDTSLVRSQYNNGKLHPFVSASCDYVVKNIQEAVDLIESLDFTKKKIISEMIKKNVDHFEKNLLESDEKALNFIKKA